MSSSSKRSLRLSGPPHVLELPSVLTEVVGHYEHACPVCQGYQLIPSEAFVTAKRCYSERSDAVRMLTA